MISARFVVATALSALALVLAIFGMVGQGSIASMGGHANMAASHFGGISGSHVPGLVALGASIASFALSWGRRSYLIAGFLSAAGILYAVHLGPFLGDHSVIALIGPLTGLIFGHVILALGVAKGIGSARIQMARAA